MRIRTISYRNSALMKILIAGLLLILFSVFFAKTNIETITWSGSKIKEDNSQKNVLLPFNAYPAWARPKEIGPCESGAAVKLLDLNSEEIKKQNKSIYTYGVNQFVSEKISLHRSINDSRHHLCKNRKPFDYKKFPSVSVIIPFYNEGNTTLLRTLYSLLHTTPAVLLKEIILVDDYSDEDHLKKPLEEYLSRVPILSKKVRLLRTIKREGLIRARILGASLAVGDVLVFFDSHCECMNGWLEPLLERIKVDESIIAMPVVDLIDWNSFEYYYSVELSTGGFTWGLVFQWYDLPEREKLRRSSPVDPIQTPVMVGSLFAISKQYFVHLGTYDAGMEIWGGENLELSFRTWMCGGKLEIIPCSHVGHIVRKEAPYSRAKFIPNSVRVAEVWMDDYKRHFYVRYPDAKLENFGDISSRIALRKRLSCNSFQWYLENIYPELCVPEDRPGYYGALHNEGFTSLCLDYAPPSLNQLSGATVSLFGCHGQGVNQFFELTSKHEIRYNMYKEMCMTFVADNNTLTMLDCSRIPSIVPYKQKWTLQGKLLKSGLAGDMCMDVQRNNQGGLQVQLNRCNITNKNQQWYFVE